MQTYKDANGNIKVAIVENPYAQPHPERPAMGMKFELSEGPKTLETGGLDGILADLGCNLEELSIVKLTPEEEEQFGLWTKLGYANGHLGRFVAATQKNGYFTIGLLANCPSLLGMLAGLQHSSGLKPLRVGLVWIDAHADFNTPETSDNGLIGSMPVAVSTGLCLHRLRLRAGLDPPLPTKYIAMTGLRKVNPYEQELIDQSDMEFLSTDDIKNVSENIGHQMKRLSQLTDIIYIHVDMDVLNPAEVPGFNSPVPGGPTSHELSAALTTMFRYEKASAIGIASTPYKNDKDNVARNAAYRLIEGAIKGIKSR
jgi:arginase